MLSNIKKTFSAIIAASLCFSTAVPLFAQKSRALPLKVTTQKAKLFSSNQAFSEGRGVWLEWQTEDEKGIVGFHLYRVSKGEKQAVAPNLIPGVNLSGGNQQSAGKSYSFFDARGDLNAVYVVEAVAADGSIQSSGKFSAGYVSDLRQVAGESGEILLRRAAESSNPSEQKDNLELPPDIESEIEANRPQAEVNPLDTQKWIAAQPGAKISVKQEGLYRVTKAQLQTAGFDINAPAANWQLFTDGVEQAVNIGPNGDYIEFYGRGIDLTETNTRVYYLVAGNQTGKRIGTKVLRRLSSSVIATNFNQTKFQKDYTSYINTVLNGDRTNFFGALVTSSGGTTLINLNGVDFGAGVVNIQITIQGYTYTPHQIRVVLNDVELGYINGSNRDLMVGSFDVLPSVLREGQNTLKLYSGAPNSNSFVDNVKINYQRKYEATQNRLSFYTTNYRMTKVQGFTSSAIRVLDMTDASNPQFISNLTIEPNGNNFNVVLPSSRGRVLYAVADNGLLSPDSVTSNGPSTLSATNNEGELIIISYKDWMAQAEDWANYRRNEGMTVKVVNAEDIYDEFSFGLQIADSIRNFLNFAKNNWQTPPSYVLLLGDASYDGRNSTGAGNLNFVPAQIVDTTYLETGSDESLADFDQDGLAELAIGRVPVRNAQTATNLLAKVVAFEQGLVQAQSRGALFVTDLPDGYDFEGVSNRLIAQLPSSLPVSSVNRAASDARTQVLNQINSGKYLLNYTGHGTVGSWAGSMFLRNDVANLTNTNQNLTIANMLTCLNGYYIEPFNEGLAEAFMRKAQGGSVISWASSGETTPDVQEIMATRFYNQLNNSSMIRMGDYVRDAKTTIAGGRDVRLSWVLLGDPTLKIKLPNGQ